MKSMYRMALVFSILTCILFAAMLLFMSHISLKGELIVTYNILKEHDNEIVIDVCVNENLWSYLKEDEGVFLYYKEDNVRREGTVISKAVHNNNYVCEIVMDKSEMISEKNRLIVLEISYTFLDILLSKFVTANP